MAEPKIVYCKYNHIYDATMHDECPYCAKIAEEQKLLNNLVVVGAEERLNVGDEIRPDSPMFYSENDAYEDESTELLLHSDVLEESSCEEQDEYTELLYTREDSVKNVLIDNREFEVKESGSGSKTTHYVIGWLVALDGEQKGHSIEIVEGNNYLSIKDDILSVSEKKDVEDSEVIYQNKNDGIFYLVPGNRIRCCINDIETKTVEVIKPYDQIRIQNVRYIFVKMVCNFVDWGV